MNVKKIGYRLLFSFLVVAAVVYPITVQADEVGGGVVQTEGEIGFYEEAQSPTTPSSATKPSDEASVSKPLGKLPSTGESAGKWSFALGLLFVFGALILFKCKNNSKEQGVER